MKAYEFVLIGKKWQITCNNGLSYSVPNHKGMYYLTELIKNVNCQIPFSAIVSRGIIKDADIEFRGDCKFKLDQYGLHEVSWHTCIPRSDREAIRQVTREMIRLQEKLRDLQAFHDYGQAEIVQTELMKLDDYLSFTYSKKKLIKRFYNKEALLYFSVKKAIQRAYEKLDVYDHELVLFLKVHIHLHPEFIQMDPYDGDCISFQLTANR